MEINKMNPKKITAEVTHDCWKQLKLLAVQKDTSLQKVIAEILEKVTNRKKIVVDDVSV